MSETLTLADVLRAGLTEYGQRYPLPPSHACNALRDILVCRTEVLGTHSYRCQKCSHELSLNNSCRNRHCPQCQGVKQAQWVEQRMQELLPVQYFHVVFTLPDLLNPLAMHAPAHLYSLLFAAVNHTMRTLAADPKWLGAKIGFIAVLHTWGQNLALHPHLHCLVPGGGIRMDKQKWKHTPRDFFIPFRVLSAVFRGVFMEMLRRHAELHLEKDTVERLYSKNWVVYAKQPFAGPRQVVKYLGRYTHRIAISNRRLKYLDATTVGFTYKDYADNNRVKQMSLPITEFIRRFISHILPRGFMRIRHFGLFANRDRTQAIQTCRHLLGLRCEPQAPSDSWVALLNQLAHIGAQKCPCCNQGLLKMFHVIRPAHAPPTLAQILA
jgi:hypothetical protein